VMAELSALRKYVEQCVFTEKSRNNELNAFFVNVCSLNCIVPSITQPLTLLYLRELLIQTRLCRNGTSSAHIFTSVLSAFLASMDMTLKEHHYMGCFRNSPCAALVDEANEAAAGIIAGDDWDDFDVDDALQSLHTSERPRRRRKVTFNLPA
jgi:hypothetical protein